MYLRDTDRDEKCDPLTQATQKQSDSHSVATYQSGEHSLLITNSEDRVIAKRKDYDEKLLAIKMFLPFSHKTVIP